MGLWYQLCTSCYTFTRRGASESESFWFSGPAHYTLPLYITFGEYMTSLPVSFPISLCYKLEGKITYQKSVRGGSSRKGHSAGPSQVPCCTWCSSPWNLEEQRQKATMKHQSPYA
jgi:hypothetical protein